MDRSVYFCFGLLFMFLTQSLDDANGAEVTDGTSFAAGRYYPDIQKSARIAHHDHKRIRAVKSRRNERNTIKISNRNGHVSVKPLQGSSNNTNVTAQTGTTATLECHVGIEDVTVMWVKRLPNTTNVWHLTVNSTTLTDDRRFSAIHSEDGKKWKLRIKYTRTSDQGLYECQVFSQPTFSIYVRLNLLEAYAEILDDEKTERTKKGMIKTVDKGFPIRLSCILHNSIKEPEYIFWYFGLKVINYELKDTASVREGRLGSELIFRRAEPENEGNYTCIPSNARQASIEVKVNYKEASPQIQTSSTMKTSVPNKILFSLLALMLKGPDLLYC